MFQKQQAVAELLIDLLHLLWIQIFCVHELFEENAIASDLKSSLFAKNLSLLALDLQHESLHDQLERCMDDFFLFTEECEELERLEEPAVP